MNIYLVVPGRLFGKTEIVAKPGWRVCVDLGSALLDMEASSLSGETRKPFLRPLRESGLEHADFSPMVVHAEIPLEHFFSCCRCEAGDDCSHDGWLRVDKVEVGSPVLLREVSGWKPVTQEDFRAWYVMRKMQGKETFDRMFKYKSSWFPRMPSSAEKAPRVIIRRP